MDFNNIQERLERLYASVKARYSHEIKKHLVRVNTPTLFSISFNDPNKKAEYANKILMIIYHLGGLKDHIHKRIVSNGFQKIGKKEIIEEEIEKSFELQLVLDLVNQEKHGYPLKDKFNRTKKNPQIGNINNILSLTTGPQKGSFAGFIFNFKTGQLSFKGAEKKDCLNS